MSETKNGETSDTLSKHHSKVVTGDVQSRLQSIHLYVSKNALKVFGFSVLAALILSAFLYAVYLHVSNPSYTVAGTTFSKKQVTTYASNLSDYSKRTNESFGNNPTEIAQHDLVLNAALKQQAKVHNIMVTDADIDLSLSKQYSNHGGKDGYQQYLQSEGIANEVNLRNENAVYEDKLAPLLLARKNIFLVEIPYDVGFFNKSKDPDALRQQGIQTLTDQFLPLFQQNLTKEAIAAKTNANTLDPSNTFAENPPSDRMFTLATYLENYSMSDPFIKVYEDEKGIKGAVDINENIAKLTKPGQYTQPLITTSGDLAIIRLESQSSGKYDSWETFLKPYLQQSGVNKNQNLSIVKKSYVTAIGSTIARPIKAGFTFLGSLLKPATAYADQSCGSEHYFTYHISMFNEDTGASVSGGTVAETFRDTDCPTKYNGNKYGLQSITAPGDMTENCDGQAPHWKITAPAGYTLDSDSNTATPTGTQSDGWPKWTGGDMNHYKNIYWKIALKKNPAPPSGSINVACQKDGSAYVSWKYTDPNGPTAGDVTITYPGGGSPYKYRTASTSNGADTGEGHYTVTAKNANGKVSASIKVYDYGGSNDKTYSDSDTCGSKTSPPTVTVNVSCNADGSGTATGSWSDKDGTTSGHLEVGSLKSASSPSGGSISVPASIASAGSWTATAKVQDVDAAHPVNTSTNTIVTKTQTSPSCKSGGGTASCTNMSGSLTSKSGYTIDGWVVHYGPTGTLDSGSYGRYPDGTGLIKGTSYSFDPSGVDPAVASSQQDIRVYTKYTDGKTVAVTAQSTFGPCGTGGGGSPPPTTACPSGTVGTYPDCSPPPPNAEFQVNGADMAAGTCFEGVNSVNDVADIYGDFNGYASARLGGSSGTLAMLLTGVTDWYNPGINLANGSGDKLRFANALDRLSQPLKGHYGNIGCVPDYFGNATSGHSSAVGPATVDVASLPDGVTYYSTTGTITLTASGPIPKGKHITLAIKGNAAVGSDILYETYSDFSEIPRFNLLVDGNLNISSSVSTLHGFYAAEPDGPWGPICQASNTTFDGFTNCMHQQPFYKSLGSSGSVSLSKATIDRQVENCNKASGIGHSRTTPTYGQAVLCVETQSFYSASLATNASNQGIIATCDKTVAGAIGSCRQNKLTVYGAVAANGFDLKRNLPTSSSDVTEIFQYSPELWLSGAHPTSTVSGVGNTWQSVTSLPPVL